MSCRVKALIWTPQSSPEHKHAPRRRVVSFIAMVHRNGSWQCNDQTMPLTTVAVKANQ